MDLSALFRVDGMVAVITGGGTGIGFVMAKTLAGAGAKVYILGRRANVLEAAASSHPSIAPIVCDVGSKASLQSAVDRVTKESGYVNLVVANSGILGPYTSYDRSLSIQELRKSLFDDVAMDDFTATMHINTTGASFTISAFLELLDAGNKNALKGGFGKPAREGSIVPFIQSHVIVTSSNGAYVRDSASPLAYVASKAAVTQLAQQAATNLAAYQIRVNTLTPGYFMSEMAGFVITSRDPETEGLDHPSFMPARRFGTEDELAGTILYLASKAGAYCNGTIFNFDGGRLSVIPSTY
ncbi:short chain dehydrogenase [Xylaria cf. heliscus]|nr:short chain dehydrogenase [Xylaria cf. heliscus]